MAEVKQYSDNIREFLETYRPKGTSSVLLPLGKLECSMISCKRNHVAT